MARNLDLEEKIWQTLTSGPCTETQIKEVVTIGPDDDLSTTLTQMVAEKRICRDQNGRYHAIV